MRRELLGIWIGVNLKISRATPELVNRVTLGFAQRRDAEKLIKPMLSAAVASALHH